jgi:class 3 adenylate cyclase/tetratricopeptide (TPR) repeat protein
MGCIFLSHAEEDTSIMRQIAEGLEASGYATWYFERDTLPGMSYLLQITRAIESCDAVVLIASTQALESSQVTKEVIGAFEREVPLFPVLIDITAQELKERQPEWRHALGGTAMVAVGDAGLPPAIASIMGGLEAMGVQPGEAEAFTPVLSTPATAAPKGVAARILAERSGLEGERKQVTVLFAQVTGLSSLDPEERHELMSILTDLISETVHYYEGTVANLSAEGFTALFGAPIAHEDDPARALHAALSIKEHLEMRPEALSLRAGANTGLVIVGAIGDDLSMEYTAIGDTVNLASHLRDASKPGTIYASEDTYRLTQGYFDFAEAGGIEWEDEPVMAYRVLAPTSADTRVEASLAKGLSRFVGRDKELAHLSECLEKASEGQGQVVGVVGEPGVGKSRLIHEFTRSLPAGEYTLLEGGCYHYGEAMPYLPILGMLKDFFDIGEADDEATIKEKLVKGLARFQGQLDTLLSPLQELLSLPVDDEAYLALEPAQRRARVFETVRGLLISESQRCPLVLVVEDLHWIDKTSEEFLGSLIDGITNSRMLLILLYRPEYTSPWTSKSCYSTVRVDQLPEKTSSELISSILSEGEVSPEVTELIVTKASGNPLFIEELAHGLLENGSIKKEDGLYVLAGKPSELEVPDTIQGIIASRLDRLAEDLKRLMQAASVIGREFAYRLLESITQMQEELKSSLSDLQESELIYEKSFFPELEYIFKHALTQEVAYNSLLRKKRRELHGSIGQAIEALYPDRMEEFYEVLAYHYARSNDTDKAIHYLRLSGEKAARSYSNWEAVGFYKEAIRLLDSLPKTPESRRQEIEVYFSALVPLWLLNFPEGSLEIIQKAEELAEEIGGENDLAQVYSKSSLYHSIKGNQTLGREYSEKCFNEAEKIGAIDLMAEIAGNTCLAYFLTGDILKVVDTTRRVLQLLEKKCRKKDLFMGGMNVFTYLSGWLGLSLGTLGRFEEGRAVLDGGLKNSIEMNDRVNLGWLEYGNFIVSYCKGDEDSTIDHARKAIEFFEETGVKLLLGYAWSVLGAGYFFLADYETAKAYAEKGVRIQKENGIPVLVPFLCHISSLIALAQRDFESARRYAEESLELSHKYENKTYEAYAWVGHGRVVGESNPSQITAAEEYIRRGMSMVEAMKIRPWSAQGHLFLGEIFELAGRREEAVENLRIAEQMGKEMGMGYWLTRTQEALARLDEYLE